MLWVKNTADTSAFQRGTSSDQRQQLLHDSGVPRKRKKKKKPGVLAEAMQQCSLPTQSTTETVVMKPPVDDALAITREANCFPLQHSSMFRMAKQFFLQRMTGRTPLLFYSADDTSTASISRQLRETGILLSGLSAPEVRELLSEDDVQSFVADLKQDPSAVFQDFITSLEIQAFNIN